jgi:uncharacterized protein (DUF2062 family)
MFVAITPTICFQTAITLALAALFRANKVVGLPIVWLTNPVTAVPIYLPCWSLGRWLTSSSEADSRAVTQKLQELFTIGEQGVLAHVFDMEFWRGVFQVLMEFGLELWLGCLVVATVAGVLTYFVTRWGVTEYRQRRRVRKIYRSVMRARVRQAKVRRRAALLQRAPAS